MSYNTRNTRQGAQGQGVGRGTTTTQIMYHQQQTPRQGVQSQQGRPSNTVQQSLPPVASSGYSSSQQSSTPAYSTQPKPLSQSFTPANTYEYQTQQAQTPQLSTPQQPPVSQFQPTPAVKAELPTPNVASVEGSAEVDMDSTGETPKRPWIKKKIPGFKVNKKIKRRRQNARLRKILQPKNAIMVLNELKAGVKFTFTEQSNALTQTLFVVNVEVDGKNHMGQGLSKPLAKQNAAENALKVLLLEKMTLAASKPLDGAGSALPMDTDSQNNGAPDTIDTMSEDGDEKPGAPDDEVPWGSLASFALFKLFTEWQSQGTHVPIAKQTTSPTPTVPAKTAPMKQLPENPTDRHPVMLLSQMRPGVKFTEKSRDGTPPNVTFTLEVEVDGVSYEGLAKNKKDAKKEAAKAALAGTLGIVYPS